MIYLDNAATTRAFDEVGERVRDCLCTLYGNPSSLHAKGLEAEHVVRDARRAVSSVLKVPEETIIFTSGGTESDNLAILGAARAKRRIGRHLVTSMLEHPAVLEPFRILSEEGFEVTYVKPDAYGILDPEEVAAAVRDDTILVSVMAVNNEIGSVEPVEQIAKTVKAKNQNTLIHCDAVQGFCKIDLFPKRAGIDLMSVSSHKIHGPKGVGALYIADPHMIRPILFGGGQQKDMRPGTENVPGIAGFGLAVQIEEERRNSAEKMMRRLKKILAQGILEIGDTHLHGIPETDGIQDADVYAGYGSSHIVSAAFRGVSAEVLLHALEDKGICVSSGSACSSNHPKTSNVLSAIGACRDDLTSTIRFSFSCETTEQEIITTLEALKELVPILRRFVRR